MSSSEFHIDIEALMMGDLTADLEKHAENHLVSCEACRTEVATLRAVEKTLRAVPPELLLDGPPPGADLLLQRTLRQNRGTSPLRVPGDGRRRLRHISAAAALVALVAGVSGSIGYTLNDNFEANAPAPVPSSAVGSPVPGDPGTRYASNLNSETGARLTVSVEPANGFVRVNAAVTGIPAGERCRLVIEGLDGTREIAGSWVISEKGAREGATIDGSAIVDLADVKAVVIENTDGKEFATAVL